jgi:PIN domain nuclease of toxin-antitoxin system
MASKKVIDAYSVLAFFENAAGADKVASLIKTALDKDRPLMISSLAWCEVCYGIYASMEKAKATAMIENALTLPLDIVAFDHDAARIAAAIKVDNKVTYSDASSIALAKLKRATLVTGKNELREFSKLVDIEIL